MSKNREHKHEPVIHISKRAGAGAAGMGFGGKILIRAIAVLLSLLVSGLLIYWITKLNPVKVYEEMFNGVFGTKRKFWAFLREALLLLCIAVGLAPAYKMRFWNIGAEGQILVGGIASAACMIYLGSSGIPSNVLLLIMICASILAGAVWGMIPAIFKANWNTNETLFTLMMNYVAIQLTSYFIPKWEHPAGSNTVGIINPTTKVGWFPKVFGQDYMLNLIIVLVLTVGMFIYLKYSKHGYEIAVVGESENTARYAAINVKKVVIRSMTISGAICGIAGFIAVAGCDHTISTDTSGGRGFVAIIVAWLAQFNTFIMVLIAGMIAFLDKGAIAIASKFNLSNDVSNVITGIILFFILGSEFFINYKVRFNFGKGGEDA